MQGIVTDSATGTPLIAVTVMNIATYAISHTDQHGVYSIPAHNGDMISFSHIGYQSIEKQTPAAIMIASLNISMMSAPYELEEYKITGDHRTQYQIDSTERKIIYHAELTRQHPNPIMSPFSALAEQFSKKAKRTYKFQKAYKKREEQRFIDTRYTPEIVHKVTSLTGDSIGHFMYASPMPYDFARAATDLELKMWVRDSYKTWADTAFKHAN